MMRLEVPVFVEDHLSPRAALFYWKHDAQANSDASLFELSQAKIILALELQLRKRKTNELCQWSRFFLGRKNFIVP